MSHYKSNVRDIEFNLFEVFGAAERWANGPYSEMDEDTARSILDEVNRLAVGPVAASFTESDRHPPIYDPASMTVTMPDEFKTTFKTLMDSEWWRLDLPEEMGGTDAPLSLRWSVAELLLGANPAAFMFMSGPGFAAILHSLGNEDQKRWANLMVENRWGATMVLTEPDAGSDVGAGRTKAIDNGDGTWRIEGVKRFITSGEHDMTDNIIHLVLARPEGARPGTKGLSLFFVPKYHFDTNTGELGARNGVYATNVEKKMGLKVSTTCELTFGANPDDPAIGWLVGDVHDGIAQMFKVIEYARMMVGTKAIATLSTGYLNALEYTKIRVQGADMADMANKAAPRVTIIHHPDVRRSLMLQKSYAEGMRALVAYAAYWQDLVHMGRAGDTEVNVDLAERMNDLLLPIVKGFGAERANEMLAQSLQLFGGSGFLQDYPIEQYRRDVTIDSLYEGVLAVQSLDLFFRKIVKDQFVAISHLASEIEATTVSRDESDPMAATRLLVAQALFDVQAMAGTLATWGMNAQTGDTGDLYRIGLNTTRFLMAAGDLIIGWLLLRQADVALAAVNTASLSDREFYAAKPVTAAWFAENRLPLLAAELRVLNATSLAVMDLPEEGF